MPKLQLLEDINKLSINFHELNINDKICHLFKYSKNPRDIDIWFSNKQPDHSIKKGYKTPVKYNNSLKISTHILDIDYIKILKTIFKCYFKNDTKILADFIYLNYNNIFNNIVWDKFPTKIKYIKPVHSMFKPFHTNSAISLNNFEQSYHYVVTPSFVKYYNNVMSGKHKMPLELLSLKDIKKIIYIKNNLFKLTSEKDFEKGSLQLSDNNFQSILDETIYRQF